MQKVLCPEIGRMFGVKHHKELMATLQHYCDNCDSEFSIRYDVEKCADDPHFCPFCSEYIIQDTTEDEDD
jgi:hypothetical protein